MFFTAEAQRVYENAELIFSVVSNNFSVSVINRGNDEKNIGNYTNCFCCRGFL